MNLSVSQRIGGGFGLLCLLLLLISAIAFTSLRSVDQQLLQVTQQATPLANKSGQLLRELLQSKYLLLSYLQADDSEAFDVIENGLNDHQQQFNTIMEQALSLSESDPASRDALRDIEAQTDQLFTDAQQLFGFHRTYRTAQNQIIAARASYLEDAEDFSYVLEDIMLDQNDYAIMDSSRTIKGDLDFIGNLLEQLLALNSSKTIAAHWQTIKAKEAQLDNQLKKLNELLGEEDFEEIGEGWALLQAQINQPELLFQSHTRSVKSKEQALEQLASVEQLIDQHEAKLLSFTDNAQQNATDAEVAAEATISRAILMIALGAAIALLVATVLSLLITRRIRSSLVQVVDGLKRVTEGDLNVSLDTKGQDEFSHLSGSVNDLTSNLRDLVQKIRNAVDDLQQNAQTSIEVSKQTLDGVANQEMQSSRVAATMTELEASAAEVEQNARQTLDDVMEAESALTNGRNLMQENSRSISSLSEQVSGSATQIQQLQEFCESIGDVVDVIRGIADQTNLLALNAAIEAARAGEQGRGFAVVADEVRSLASRTQGSTIEIEEMVDKLQQGARSSVSTMAECSVQASQSLTQIQSSTEQLDNVAESVSSIRQMNSQVAQATGEQRSTTEEVSRSLSEINKITETTAAGAQDTAQQSETLTALAKQLGQVISKFQV
ncbi:MAG: methyl-accepting chemotaxis protein [Motiliproteus sp.]